MSTVQIIKDLRTAIASFENGDPEMTSALRMLSKTDGTDSTVTGLKIALALVYANAIQEAYDEVK
jgi:hypothetical protein